VNSEPVLLRAQTWLERGLLLLNIWNIEIKDRKWK
jgi:hypothetical protein